MEALRHGQEGQMSIAANHYPLWRAELTIGTRQGYMGSELITPTDVISLVQLFQDQIADVRWFAVIVWARGTVLGQTFPRETVIRVTLESNPLYSADASEQEVADYATALADYLAEQLQQARIYVALYPFRGLIVESTQAEQLLGEVKERMHD
jgi:hypothetical protein